MWKHWCWTCKQSQKSGTDSSWLATAEHKWADSIKDDIPMVSAANTEPPNKPLLSYSSTVSQQDFLDEKLLIQMYLEQHAIYVGF